MIESLAKDSPHLERVIESVTLLGYDGELKYQQKADGLHVALPKEKPCDFAYVLKVSTKTM